MVPANQLLQLRARLCPSALLQGVCTVQHLVFQTIYEIYHFTSDTYTSQQRTCLSNIAFVFRTFINSNTLWCHRVLTHSHMQLLLSFLPFVSVSSCLWFPSSVFFSYDSSHICSSRPFIRSLPPFPSSSLSLSLLQTRDTLHQKPDTSINVASPLLIHSPEDSIMAQQLMETRTHTSCDSITSEDIDLHSFHGHCFHNSSDSLTPIFTTPGNYTFTSWGQPACPHKRCCVNRYMSPQHE